MGRHRTFSADRFLDKFQGREPLIRGYAGLWDGRLELDGAKLDVPGFKEFLVNGDGDGKDELLEGLYRTYDLCTERGHEDLVAACGDFDFDPDPEGELPVECLSLKVRVENEDAFNLAYDRNTVWLAERFSLYRGKTAKGITDPAAAADRFQEKLGEFFKDDKKSDRVLVRQYRDQGDVPAHPGQDRRGRQGAHVGGPGADAPHRRGEGRVQAPASHAGRRERRTSRSTRFRRGTGTPMRIVTKENPTPEDLSR